MKIFTKVSLIILSVILLSVCAIIGLIGLIEYSWLKDEKEYYSDTSNFITVTAKYEKIENVDDDGKYIIIGISEPEDDIVLSEYRFVIIKDNTSVLQNNGFFDEIQSGDKITFITAPRIFGDGYEPPIVAISKGDKVYLDFETGYSNLMEKYN